LREISRKEILEAAPAGSKSSRRVTLEPVSAGRQSFRRESFEAVPAKKKSSRITVLKTVSAGNYRPERNIAVPSSRVKQLISRFFGA
jgi:hypothetical protein